MKQPIFKLELSIADTSEACIAATLERILNEINRGCCRGFDRYFDEDENHFECGSYEYQIEEKFVEQENLMEEI